MVNLAKRNKLCSKDIISSPDKWMLINNDKNGNLCATALTAQLLKMTDKECWKIEVGKEESPHNNFMAKLSSENSSSISANRFPENQSTDVKTVKIKEESSIVANVQIFDSSALGCSDESLELIPINAGPEGRKLEKEELPSGDSKTKNRFPENQSTKSKTVEVEKSSIVANVQTFDSSELGCSDESLELIPINADAERLRLEDMELPSENKKTELCLLTDHCINTKTLKDKKPPGVVADDFKLCSEGSSEHSLTNSDPERLIIAKKELPSGNSKSKRRLSKNQTMEAKTIQVETSPSVADDLTLDPPTSAISCSGGSSEHSLINAGPERLIFKLEFINNKRYSASHHFGFVEPYGYLDISINRMFGLSKNTKLIIRFGVAPAGAENAMFSFHDLTCIESIDVPLDSF